MIALSLSASGEAERKPFPDLPGDAGTVKTAQACHWVDDQTLLVLATSSRGPFGAIWLDSEFAVTGWLPLEQSKGHDISSWSIGQVAPGQFVMVGMSMLRPVAFLFDRQRGQRLALPWATEAEAQPWPDGPQAGLMDVSADQRGGFALCGMEARLEGGSVPSGEILLATFDDRGAVRSQTRLPGKNCRLLPSASGQVRVLHDDGVVGGRTLLLTTLDDSLVTLSGEPLVTPFVSEWRIFAVELDQRFVFVSPFFAWETLEIRGKSLRQSIDLDVKAGGVIELLAGPSRVYLVSQMATPAQPGSPRRVGTRIDAFDVTSPTLR